MEDYNTKQYIEALYKVIPSAVFTVDKDRIITSWSDKAAILTGYGADEVVGKRCSDIVGTACMENNEENCDMYENSPYKVMFTREGKMCRKDGVVVNITKNIHILRDEKGDLLGAVESFEDITHRRQVEETVRKLSRAVEQSPSVIVITDLEGTIEYVNPKFTQITGFPFGEVKGKKTSVLKSGMQTPDFYKDMWEKLGSGEEWRGEFHNKKKNGDFYWEFASISPVRDSIGFITNYLKVAEDITERKKTEASLALAKKELEEKNKKLQELDQLKSKFLSTVSHELRTPLSITKEGISLVLDGVIGDTNEKQQKILSTAKNNIDRLARIINNLLDISKIEAGKIGLRRELCDVVAIVEQVISSFSFSAEEKGLRIKLSSDKDRIDAHLDIDRVSQIFTNLLGNAVKFTEKGYVEISLKESEDDVECAVYDTGVGIRKDEMSKVFERFHQVGRKAGAGEKGTGLGLSIAKELVEMHGGKMWVESEEGKWTKFVFILPKHGGRNG